MQHWPRSLIFSNSITARASIYRACRRPTSTSASAPPSPPPPRTNPLPNATVKLFDSQGVPYRHVLTDTEGAYAFTNVPAGTYTVAAACAGHLMSPGAGLTLTGGDSLQVPLVCAPETTLSLGAIAGLVTSTGLEGILPVAGATITLRDLTGAAVASTTSADDGEFVFYDVADGVYSLLATADGYLVTAPIAVTITRGSIANVAVTMVLDSRTYSGTVSGIIRGSNGAPVSGCFVGLYAVTGEGAARVERLIAATKTNAEGKYLFGGVTGGKYIVKAKQSA